MKLEPQILREAYDQAALGAAVAQILVGMAVVVAVCTAMAALSEFRRGISAAVGWLALGLVGAVLAAAFAIHGAMPAAGCAVQIPPLTHFTISYFDLHHEPRPIEFQRRDV